MDLPTLLAQQKARFAAAKQRSQQRAVTVTSSSSPLAARIEKHKGRLKELEAEQKSDEGLAASLSASRASRPVSTPARVFETPAPSFPKPVDSAPVALISSIAVSSRTSPPSAYPRAGDGLKFSASSSSLLDSRRSAAAPSGGRVTPAHETKLTAEDLGGDFVSFPSPATPEPRSHARKDVRGACAGGFNCLVSLIPNRMLAPNDLPPLVSRCPAPSPQLLRSMVDMSGAEHVSVGRPSLSSAASLSGARPRVDASSSSVVYTLNQEVTQLTAEIHKKNAVIERLQCVAPPPLCLC